jgi:hypothetical protein
MFPRAREFFASSGGRLVAIAIGVVGLVIVIWTIKGTFGESDAAAISADRIYIDSTTMKPFQHELRIGETIPVKAPSGGMTGYPAELCYWTKDGKINPKPTPVLLNEVIGKSGPTFCPVCGRLVVAHNPPPEAGGRPPPTKEEYERRHAR